MPGLINLVIITNKISLLYEINITEKNDYCCGLSVLPPTNSYVEALFSSITVFGGETSVTNERRNMKNGRSFTVPLSIQGM